MAYDSYRTQKVPGRPVRTRVPFLASADAYASTMQAGDVALMGYGFVISTVRLLRGAANEQDVVSGPSKALRPLPHLWVEADGLVIEDHSQWTLRALRS